LPGRDPHLPLRRRLGTLAGVVPFGSWPTPLESAPRLAEAIGLDHLWLKRDDLTGLGGGGNKVRKLEVTCAEALAAGATTLVTTGAPQSNHARVTAAAAARLGLGAVLVLAGDRPAESRGNLVLDELAGAELAWAGDIPFEAMDDAVEDQVARVREAGGVPWVIPLGGSTAASAQAYADCGSELKQQVPDAEHVVVAFGSGGTAAGLAAALGEERVLAVDVGALADPAARFGELLDGMPGVVARHDALRLDRDQVGDGYEELTPAAREALTLAARTEGVFLDPTYTARALAALVAHVADGRIARNAPTVFMHTGGLPGLFAHPGL
jgi:L-cysteate sulfo-lyase